MSVVSKGMSAVGRLVALAALAAAFLLGMASVVYMSLQGSEVKVPEITGKELRDGETELAHLGLKVKNRAQRISAERVGTIIEQVPKAGETVKTGQMIYVVTSKGPGENGEVPLTSKPTTEADDTEKIEEMISDKPKKKTNSNTNRKKADTTRDVNTATGNSNSNSSSTDSNSNKKEPATNNNSSDKPNKNTQPATKPSDKPKPERRPNG